MRYIITLIIALAFIVFVYLLCENFIMLVCRRVKLGNRLRILHISDVHRKRYGNENMLIAYRAELEKPDLIFITGDMISRKESDFTVTESILRELCDIAPVYMVLGNHEQSFITVESVEKFYDMLARTDVILLRNEIVQTEIKGVRLNICGIEPAYTIYKKNEKYKDLDKITLSDMNSMLGNKPDGETLLLAHNPFFGETYAEWGADYTFSGHVHGGAVRLFGVGILSPERKFFPKYAKGEYDIGGMKLFVSGGIGKLRAFNPPEVVLYEI